MFPEFLDRGSQGGAVVLLQLMLKFAGYNRDIVPDGDYGGQTAAGVKELQMDLGYTGPDVDGNFGPKTRKDLEQKRGIDFNSITLEMFSQLTVPATQKS